MMMRSALSAAVVLATSMAASGASCYGGGLFTQSDWPHCFVASASPSILVYSAISTSGKFLRLGMYTEGHTGWTALAFASNGGMKGAREIVVRKENNEWKAEDRYSQTFAMPVMMPTQDVKLISASEEGGSTSWAVLLDLNSCKPEMNEFPTNFDLTIDREQFMLWALGNSHTFSYHKSRGNFHVNLISGPAQKPSLAGLESIDFLMPNVDVVAGDEGTASDPYICGIVDLAVAMPGKNLSEKHHIVALRPKIASVSAKYVHHILLYGCSGEGFSHNQIVKSCQTMPPGCSDFKWAWAVGGEDLIFPETVGLPFGEGEKYFALQMHYYNPNLDANVKDSSGVEVVFAPSIRPIDAGLMTFVGGTDPSNHGPLPAGKSNVKIGFDVPATCFDSWEVPEVNLLGIFYHAHVLGTWLNMEVSHNGQYISNMYSENNYDFNHQFVHAPNVKKLRKGDELRITCRYDTSSQSSPVQFGESTNTEMCAMLMYYSPRQALSDIGYDRETENLATTIPFLEAECSQPGSHKNFTHLSLCTQDAFLEPYFFFLGSPERTGYYKYGYDLYRMCTIGSGQGEDLTTPQEFNNYIPGLCLTSCFTSGCTPDELIQHVQDNVCTQTCGQFQLSVYPNTSMKTAFRPNQVTRCGKRVYFKSTDYAIPVCEKVGDVTSSNATAAMLECSSCSAWGGKQVTGKIAMIVDNITQLSQPAAITGLKNAIAQVAGVSADSVSVTVRAASRRLESSERLLTVAAIIDYVINAPVAASATIITKMNTAPAATVANAVTQAMSAQGITQTFSVTSITAQPATTQPPSTTVLPQTTAQSTTMVGEQSTTMVGDQSTSSNAHVSACLPRIAPCCAILLWIFIYFA